MRRPGRFLLAVCGAAASALAEGVFFDARFSTGFDDVRTGMRLGGEAELSRFRLAVFADADFGPMPLGTRVTIQEGRRYAPGEAGYALGPGFAVAIPAGDNLFVVTGAGVFRVEDEERGRPWSGWTEAGLRYMMSEICHVEACWQYRPMPDAAAHRFALLFRFRPA